MKESIYTCPNCGEKTFNPWTKALAGQLNSKGRPCPNCGTRVTNDNGVVNTASGNYRGKSHYPQ